MGGLAARVLSSRTGELGPWPQEDKMGGYEDKVGSYEDKVGSYKGRVGYRG